MSDNCVRYFKVPHRDMVYLKFVMEAHEGLATLSTADKLEGIVRVSCHYTVAPTVNGLIDALQREIPMIEAFREPADGRSTDTFFH